MVFSVDAFVTAGQTWARRVTPQTTLQLKGFYRVTFRQPEWDTFLFVVFWECLRCVRPAYSKWKGFAT